MSTNELRNRSRSTEFGDADHNDAHESPNDLANQPTTSQSSDSIEANLTSPANNRLNEPNFHMSNLSHFNWRQMLAPVLNLFTNQQTITDNPNGQATANNQSQHAPSSSARRDSPSDPVDQANPMAGQRAAESNSDNENLFSESITETFDIHLNLNFDQNTVFISRSHLIRVIFFKISIFYLLFLPSYVRKALEYGLLSSAILSFLTLVYLHSLFIRNPINCLQDVQTTWNGEGILRVEILDEQERLINFNLEKNSSTTKDLDKNLKEFEIFSKQVRPSNFYVVEYSREYGFLRLSQDVRNKLNISIMTVTLDSNKDQCFGDQLSRFILRHFLGFNDVLLNSLKGLAENQSSRGYIKNLVTDEYFRFINIQMTRASYVPAAFIMLLFTLTISMLIRYSHHQILVLTMQIFNMLQPTAQVVNFPFAQICTVILALIGMEAIMSEFFNGNNTQALNVILIVWAADVFDWGCCNTTITKRNWLKFFYLYHFAFYAYAYRFNGQYSNLALLSSGLFTAHSMIYFLHNYEIPYILRWFGTHYVN